MGFLFYSYLEQYANIADLKQFYALYLPRAVNSTLEVELFNGGLLGAAVCVHELCWCLIVPFLH